MNYEKIIIIGTKDLAKSCIQIAHNFTNNIEAIIHIDNFDFGYSKEYLVKNKIPFQFEYNKKHLTKETIHAGIKVFKDLAEDLLLGKVKSYKQPKGIGKMHYSWEIPNHGKINQSWNCEEKSRFLRSMNYPGLIDFEKNKGGVF